MVQVIESEMELPSGQLRSPASHVLGWWNRAIPGTTIGTLFIFLAECGLVARLSNADTVEVAVDARSHGIKNIPAGGWRCVDASEYQDAALSVLAGIELVDKIYACGSETGFRALSSQLAMTHKTWPPPKPNGLHASYDTTKYVRALWAETGMLAPLKFRFHLRKWAEETIRKQFGKRPVVGLHLKNVPHQGASSISLADESAWYDFLSAASARHEIGFLLLGDDPVKESILELPNIALARKIGADSLAKHMALLGQCAGFMGIMSALCNLALFSDIPYAIFKNPDHHREEMLSEIGENDHYPFANHQQKIFRVNETPALLLSELERMPFIKGFQ